MQTLLLPDCPAAIQSSGRHALSGVLPTPQASTVGNGWRGVIIDFFTGTKADFTGRFDNHDIVVYLNGCIDLYQCFEGKSAQTRMRRGSIQVCPAGATKKLQHKGGGDFLVVHIAPELLLQVAADMHLDNPEGVELRHTFCTRDQRIEELSRELWNEYQTNDLASAICAEALGNQLAVRLLRNYSTAEAIAPPPSSKLSARALKRAMDYVESNLASDLTLEEIARALAMSAGHFAHAFKNATGMAPHRYVVERRIEAAKLLLRESELPIGNLASLVGFSTHSHFCATFQRLVGESPRSFRRRE
jgi:AraC family transcriptional regulator